MAWTKRYKDGLNGLEMESRKCTNKGQKMDDVWIPKCQNNSFEDLAEVVESGLYTEDYIVKRAKQGMAIEAQHQAKAGLSDKLTKSSRDAIYDTLTNAQIAECGEKPGGRSTNVDALIKKIHAENIAEMLESAEELAEVEATVPEEPTEEAEENE